MVLTPGSGRNSNKPLFAELGFPALCIGGGCIHSSWTDTLRAPTPPHQLAVAELGQEPRSLFVWSFLHALSLSLSLSLSLRFQSVFLTLTTCFRCNLPSKPLTHLKISKSPHNLSRRAGNKAAYNFLDSHHPSPQSTALLIVSAAGFPRPQSTQGCLDVSC